MAVTNLNRTCFPAKLQISSTHHAFCDVFKSMRALFDLMCFAFVKTNQQKQIHQFQKQQLPVYSIAVAVNLLMRQFQDKHHESLLKELIMLLMYNQYQHPLL